MANLPKDSPLVAPKSTLISRLPAELLAEPFMWLRGMYADPAYPNELKEYIAFTHVCRRWRTVAIDNALLWDFVPLYTYEWTRIVIERSKAIPLSATLTNSSPACQDAAVDYLVQNAWDRIGDLVVYDYPLRVLDRPIPTQLRTLLLTDNIPDGIFLGQAPSHLTWLHIFSGTISPHSPLLAATLKHLHLGLDRTWLSMQNLLEVLSRLPHLQELSLYGDALNFTSPEQRQALFTVHLPYLAVISLSADPVSLSTFLNFVHAPANDTVVLHMNVSGNTAEKVDVIRECSAAAARWAFPSNITAIFSYRQVKFLSASQSNDVASSVTCQGGIRCIDAADHLSYHNPLMMPGFLEFTIECEELPPYHIQATVIQTICAQLPVHSPEEVIIDGPWFPFMFREQVLVQVATALECLRLRGNAACATIFAPRIPLTMETDTTPSAFNLSSTSLSLHRVRLEDVDFIQSEDNRFLFECVLATFVRLVSSKIEEPSRTSVRLEMIRCRLTEELTHRLCSICEEHNVALALETR